MIASVINKQVGSNRVSKPFPVIHRDNTLFLIRALVTCKHSILSELDLIYIQSIDLVDLKMSFMMSQVHSMAPF